MINDAVLSSDNLICLAKFLHVYTGNIHIGLFYILETIFKNSFPVDAYVIGRKKLFSGLRAYLGFRIGLFICWLRNIDLPI